MRIWIVALGVVAVLALAGGYWYGSWESDEVLVKQSADTASEGIKVHGDWEVTVSDPATGEEIVYAFENALYSKWGAGTLTSLISGETISHQIGIKPWFGYTEGTYHNDKVWTGLDCEEVKMPPINAGVLESETMRDTTSKGSPLTVSATCTVDVASKNLSTGQIVDVDKGTVALTEVQTLLTVDFVGKDELGYGPDNLMHQDNLAVLFTSKVFETPLEVDVGYVLGFNVRISFE